MGENTRGGDSGTTRPPGQRAAWLVAGLVAWLTLHAAVEGWAGDDGTSRTIECIRRHPIPVRAEPLGEPVVGLEPLPGIPLPSLGPDADGYFHPPRGYAEGGRFTRAEERPEWHLDPEEGRAYRSRHGIAERSPGWLRVVEFNVARGEHLDEVIRLLKRVDVDVVLGNEGDLHGRITGGRVAAREIARALGCSYFTSLEFYELRDDRRGTSGNFIVSCAAPLRDGAAMRIPIPFGAFNWDVSLDQPRCGERSALSAYADIEDRRGRSVPVQLVTLHTENWALSGARRQMFEAVREAFLVPGEQAIWGGDLNTVAPFEADGFRRYINREYAAAGPEGALRACSYRDDTRTSGVGQIDWVLLQSPDHALRCYDPDAGHEARPYAVLDPLGSSDHSPVFVHVFVAGPPEPERGVGRAGKGIARNGAGAAAR